MMKRLAIFGMTCLLLAMVASDVEAQVRGRSSRLGRSGLGQNRRPTISPYLNLLNAPNTGLAYEYFRQVRPAQQLTQSNIQLSQSVEQLNQQVSQQQDVLQRPLTDLTPTGRAASFMTHSRYFNTRGIRP